MSWSPVAEAGRAAIDAGISNIPIIGGIFSNAQNLYAQREQQAYDRAQTEIVRQREDNAVQRRAADLEAAGLSKTLAAGGAAQASNPIKSLTPQMEKGTAVADALGLQSEIMSLKKQKMDIARTEQELKNMRLQNDRMNIENKYLDESLASKNRKLALENTYAIETLTDRIKFMNEKLTGEQLQNQIKIVDKQLKDLRVTTEQLNQARIMAETAIANYKRDTMLPMVHELDTQELLTKQLAHDIIKEKHQEWVRNREIYRSYGIPSDGMLGAGLAGQIMQGAQGLTTQANELLKKFGF